MRLSFRKHSSPVPDASPNRAEVASAVFKAVQEVEHSLKTCVDDASLFQDLRVRVLPVAEGATVHLRLSIRYGVRIPEAAARLQACIRERLLSRFALAAVHVVIEVKDVIFD